MIWVIMLWKKKSPGIKLYIADEIFACGTAAEVTPVTKVDHRPIGNGKRGPVTKIIQDLFFQTVEGNGKRSAEWLDYVEVPAMAAIG